MNSSTKLAIVTGPSALSPIVTQDDVGRDEKIVEMWLAGRASNTQRAYREDVMSFVQFLAIAWPTESTAMLSVSIKDVLAFREQLVQKNAAPKTINRRISSISSF